MSGGFASDRKAHMNGSTQHLWRRGAALVALCSLSLGGVALAPLTAQAETFPTASRNSGTGDGAGSGAEAGAAPSAEASIAAATLTADATTIPAGGGVTLTYSRVTPADDGQWIGIYKTSITPGAGGNEIWEYVSGQSGSITLSLQDSSAGNYIAYFFADGGYTPIAQLPLIVEGPPAAEPTDPATISGVVNATAEDGSTHPIAGVTVFDGDGANMATTASDGSYTLTIDTNRRHDELIYITVPSGYSAPVDAINVPQFYKNLGVLTGADPVTANFELQEDSRSADTDFTFAQITDMHARSDWDATSRAIPHQVAIGTLDTNPAFVVHTGDISLDGGRDHWDAVKQTFAESPIPVWPVVGNHDVVGNADPKNKGLFGTYRAVLGPEWYSFDYGQRHFIVLENNVAGDDAAQRDWLIADLAANGFNADGSSKEMVLLFHKPWDSPDHADGAGWRDLLAPFDVKLMFSGHEHVGNASRHVLGDALHKIGRAHV